MSDPHAGGHDDHKKSEGGKPFPVSILFWVLLILIVIFSSYKIYHSNGKKQDTNTEVKSILTPYTEIYRLRTSESETHSIPVGYRVEISNDKDYLYVTPNSDPEQLWGPTGYHEMGIHVQQFSIRKHESDKETIVTVTYTPL